MQLIYIKRNIQIGAQHSFITHAKLSSILISLFWDRMQHFLWFCIGPPGPTWQRKGRHFNVLHIIPLHGHGITEYRFVFRRHILHVRDTVAPMMHHMHFHCRWRSPNACPVHHRPLTCLADLLAPVIGSRFRHWKSTVCRPHRRHD